MISSYYHDLETQLEYKRKEVEHLKKLLKMAEDEAVASDDHARKQEKRADQLEADLENLHQKLLEETQTKGLECDKCGEAMKTINCYSPYYDADENRTIMSIDNNGSWVHIKTVERLLMDCKDALTGFQHRYSNEKLDILLMRIDEALKEINND